MRQVPQADDYPDRSRAPFGHSRSPRAHLDAGRAEDQVGRRQGSHCGRRRSEQAVDAPLPATLEDGLIRSGFKNCIAGPWARPERRFPNRLRPSVLSGVIGSGLGQW